MYFLYMDLLFKHTQEKVDKYENKSRCDLKLFSDNLNLIFQADYQFDYKRYGTKKDIQFEHMFNLDMTTGDISVTYRILNNNVTSDEMFRNKIKHKKNNFNLIFDLCENGFMRGEKRIGYWGVKFHRAQDKFMEIITKQLKDRFKTQFYKDKDYSITKVNRMYDLLVDFHLDAKSIKSHDGIYYDIQNDYPKKKWLIKNDFKFLPAVLDSYGIKSRYLIGELNKNNSKPIHIGSLNYICKLFGSNHIDYLKQFVWMNHCYDLPNNKKTHQLKNDSEKLCMVKCISNWETDTLKSDSLIYSINKLLSIREQLEERGVDLKFKAKNDNEFENHMDTWSSIKTHFSRGYKVRYDIPQDIVDEIEKDITINDEIYKPTVLLTEDDYRLEGFVMKNCMSKQFPHGAFYIHVSLQNKRKRVNLQYRKGNLIQSYGKANTPVLESFIGAIDLLSERMKNFSNLEWKKEKYDHIGR